jgi:SAM-dependent methyltransferase
MDLVPADVASTLRRLSYEDAGFAERYDAARPSPPAVLLDLLPMVAGVERPACVVDLGAGTGLSTRCWAARADRVVGVEPSAAMRAEAARRTSAPNVSYVAGAGSATGLPDGSADLVTAAQSFQWMEPASAFAEIGRLLRPGGVFAAYQYGSVTTASWEAVVAFEAVRAAVREKRAELGLDAERSIWPVTRSAFAESGVFRYAAATMLHSVEEGSGERLVAFALSEGSLQTLLPHVTEAEIGLDRLREAAESLPSGPWYLGYHLFYGVK